MFICQERLCIHIVCAFKEWCQSSCPQCPPSRRLSSPGISYYIINAVCGLSQFSLDPMARKRETDLGGWEYVSRMDKHGWHQTGRLWNPLSPMDTHSLMTSIIIDSLTTPKMILGLQKLWQSSSLNSNTTHSPYQTSV